MKKLGLNEIRELYLNFFESKGHLRLDSFPLVPQNDKSLLLINAGMAPLKPYFTGEQVPPAPRVTSCQKCIRTPDIENVGKTARHGTYFEMLGNFSFGDYFKKEAATFAWEFVTKVLEMPVDRLWVSIYLEDDEAFDIWTKEVGVAADHIFRMGKKDNFWEIGQGPCGPCSEIYYDRGEKYKCDDPNCAPGCDCDRYLEFWNLVFTQFYNDGNGNYTPLAKKNIDTGMGLERIAAIMQDVESLFDVDTMQDIMNHIIRISEVKYGVFPATDVSLRVITDHIRSTVMLISDGVIPSNEGRGYVLRRLLRRAVRHGRLIGITEPFMEQVCDTVIQCNKGAYPQLVEKEEYLKKVISMEELRFSQTLESGLLKLEDMISTMAGHTQMSGEDAFKLYDTYGFPIDLTLEILDEKGLTVDSDGFEKAMKAQRVRAKSARTDVNTAGWEGELISLTSLPETIFKGYEQSSCKGNVLAIINHNELVSQAAEGDQITLVFDQTPFYAESGGQCGDSGQIQTKTATATVQDVKKTPDGKFLHYCTVENGLISLQDTATLSIDQKRRQQVAGAHSSVHLLHEALRIVLGKHVQQAGSLVEPCKIRFDFTHFSPMTDDELTQVETLVNDTILDGLAVSSAEMPLTKAKELGATALFGEKYGLMVRVVNMGGFSVELCGGTHIDNIAKIGLFKITGEASVAAGVRRIEAVTGHGALDYIRERNAIITNTAEVLKTTPADLMRRAVQLQNEIKTFHRQVEQLDDKLSKFMAVDLLNYGRTTGGVIVVAVKVDDVNGDMLRNLTDSIRTKRPNVACVLACVTEDGKINFAAACGSEAVKKGVHAGNILKEIAKICGGGGGGRPDSATAGGTNVAMLEKALEQVNNIVELQTAR